MEVASCGISFREATPGKTHGFNSPEIFNPDLPLRYLLHPEVALLTFRTNREYCNAFAAPEVTGENLFRISDKRSERHKIC